MSAVDPRQFTSCFTNWMAQQEGDLDELLHGLHNATPADDHLRLLVARIMRHFEEYSARRRALVRRDPPAFLCPWNSTFENSILWLGGCRPTMCVRLAYYQSSAHLEANLEQFLSGGAAGAGEMLQLSAAQLNRVNGLHQRAIREEQRLGERFATLQVDVADGPLVPITVGEMGGGGGGGDVVRNGGIIGEEVRAAMDGYEQKLAMLVDEADELRIRIVREMVTEILTPRQAAELLAAGKQLQLSLHDWGSSRDRERGHT